MVKIRAGWSGRIIRNGTMKNEFTCNSCGSPCIKICGIGDDWPKNCIDTEKRKEVEKKTKEEMTKAA
jgi:hypothetical protein